MQDQNGNQGEEMHLLLARTDSTGGVGIFHMANANNNTVAPCKMLADHWLTSEQYQDYHNYLTQDKENPTTILEVGDNKVILRAAKPVSAREEINNQRRLGDIYNEYLNGNGNDMSIKDFVVSKINIAKAQQQANENVNNDQNNNVNQNIPQNIQPANNLFNIMPFNGNQQINNNMFGSQPNNNMFGLQSNNMFGSQPNNNMFGSQPNNMFGLQSNNMFGSQPNNINNMNNNVSMNNNMWNHRHFRQQSMQFGVNNGINNNMFGPQPNNMFGSQPNNINNMNNNVSMNNNMLNHGHFRMRSMQFGVNNGLQNFNGLNGNNAFC